MPIAETAIRLADHSLLVIGRVKFALTYQSSICLGSQAIKKPYDGSVFETPDGKYYAIVLTDEIFSKATHLHQLNVATPGAKEWTFPDMVIQEPNAETLATISPALRREIFRYVMEALTLRLEIAGSPRFFALLGLLIESLPSRAVLQQAFWLAPHLVYLQGSVQGDWPSAHAQLLMVSQQDYHKTRVHTFQISPTEFAAIAVFDQPICPEEYRTWKLCLMHGHASLAIQGVLADKAFGLEFMQYLNGRPDYQRHLIRERVSAYLLEHSPEVFKENMQALLQKLQLFVQVENLTLSDARLPFNLHFEQVMPIAKEGLFISGWLRDPCQMLESIEAVSALGFSFPLQDAIQRVKRDDVRREFLNSPFGQVEEDQGFFAFAPIPEDIQAKLKDAGELYSFRFRVRLKGHITLDVTPPMQQRDVFTARDVVIRSVASEVVSDAMLQNCFAPAAKALQALCMEQVGVRDVVMFGEMPSRPLVSLVIPLYKRVDFVKVHFATMANDPSMEECELIYVLDSPEQEHEVRAMIGELHQLYGLPAKLVIMKRNAGYAAATNTGAAQARGRYLVLMNSDVFPAEHGWTHRMASFMAGNKKVGTLAPKLVYEDNAIQHAGMYFVRTTYPFWLNMHYYKGYPSDYADANVARAVPAVTGACLMMERSLYEKVGGLTTDYVIGDFEDSDLCLKCHAAGYESWYLPEVSLYHLERQSVPLHQGYLGSLAWRYNGMLHQQRWGSEIEAIMQAFEAVQAEEPIELPSIMARLRRQREAV